MATTADPCTPSMQMERIVTPASDPPHESNCSQLDEKDSPAVGETDDRRISKRTRTRRSLVFTEKTISPVTDTDPNPVEVQPEDKIDAVSRSTSEDKKKQRSLWTVPETQAFFEALAEHGKDFQAIQSFIHNKLAPDVSKKNKISVNKSSASAAVPVSLSSTPVTSATLSNGPQVSSVSTVTEVKSREQVRHFYYRTWHKISSSCHFEEALKSLNATDGSDSVSTSRKDGMDKLQDSFKEIDKAILELYGLINYGEIWKKFPSKWDARIKSHLKELVLEGSTVIKSSAKVKAIKFRTPICKALKKIHGLDVSTDSAASLNPAVGQPLPDDIFVQLLPRDNESFCRIQSMARNPRLRCRIPIQKRISSLIEFLENCKWTDRRPICDDEIIEETDDSFKKFKIRLTLHNSHLKLLELSNPELTIGPASMDDTCSNLTPCSSLSLSFKNFLKTRMNRKSVSSAKSGRKEKNCATSTAAVSAPTSSKNTQSEFSPIKSVVSDDIAVQIEDSCSSTSSVTPFRDAVKKLALLNKALSSADMDFSEKEDAPQTTAASESINTDDQQEKKGKMSSPVAEMVSSLTEEVSLPPPTATLAQWLNSREDRHAGDGDAVPDHDAGTESDVHSSTVDEKVVLDYESIRDGWKSDETSISFSELYLLLKSPPKITFNYEFITESPVGGSRHRYILPGESIEYSDCTSLLDKLFAAASISLSLHKKMSMGNPNAGISPLPPYLKLVENGSRSSAHIVNNQQLSGQTSSVIKEQNGIISSHNFLIPSGPAPKAATHASPNCAQLTCESATSTSNVSTNRNASVNNNKRQRFEDPQILEDAIKQLNQNRLLPKKRQRVIRPITVGPVQSKHLLPHLNQSGDANATLQMLRPVTAAAAPVPQTQIQILSASAADTSTATVTSGISLPICFAQSAVPTILIPTVITANLNAAAPAAPTPPTLTIDKNSAAVSLNPASATREVSSSPSSSSPPSAASAAANSHNDSTSFLSSSQTCNNNKDKKPENVPETSGDPVPHNTDAGLNRDANVCLSSLLDLSLPDSLAPPTSTSSSISQLPFFSDNSCSSISEFMSFGNPNMGHPASLNGSQSESALGLAAAKESNARSGQTPNWLLNEGSNSSSLGLSSLIFNSNELI